MVFPMLLIDSRFVGMWIPLRFYPHSHKPYYYGDRLFPLLRGHLYLVELGTFLLWVDRESDLRESDLCLSDNGEQANERLHPG